MKLSNKIIPNLFIIGAAKCGTTTLHHILSAHQDIYMSSVKEPHFFSTVHSQNPEAFLPPEPGKEYHTKVISDSTIYASLFETIGKFKYRGEASPSYMYDPQAAKKIYAFNPDAKIIAILREPIARAFSHFQMAYQLGLESEQNFFQALQKDAHHPDKGWGKSHLYQELGMYHQQLQRYSKLFSSNQILVIRTADLKTKPELTLSKVYQFLNLSDNLRMPENESQNKAQHAKYDWLRTARRFPIVKKLKNLLGSSLKAKVKSRLYTDGYADVAIDDASIAFLKKAYDEDLKALATDYSISFPSTLYN